MKKILTLLVVMSMLLVSVSAVTPASKFTDVSAKAYYVDALNWAMNNKAVSGTSDTTFSPAKNLTRQDMCVILYQVLKAGENTMTQIDDTSTEVQKKTDYNDISMYAKQAVAVCYNAGVISGYADGTIGPKKNITRQEFAVMIVSALKVGNYEQTLNIPQGFSSNAIAEAGDYKDIAAWAMDKYQWAAACGIIGYKIAATNTTAPKTCPKDTLTRAEAVQMIYKAFGMEDNYARDYWNAKAQGETVDYGKDDSLFNDPTYLVAADKTNQNYIQSSSTTDMYYVESDSVAFNSKDETITMTISNGRTEKTLNMSGKVYAVNQTANDYSIGLMKASSVYQWITENPERANLMRFECDGDQVYAVHLVA